MIKLLRVDHRLLHGQVTFSWVNALGVDAILIASDTLLNDEIRKTAVALAKPVNTRLVLKSIDGAIESINSGVTDKYKLMIIVESIDDAYRLAMNCPSIESVNLGGVKIKDGATKIGSAVYCVPEEFDQLDELVDRGIEVEIRQVANDKKQLYKKGERQ